eukprot:g75116.t1
MQTSVPYNSQAQDSPISSKLRAQEEPVDMTLEHSARERLAEAYENTVEKTRVTIHPSPLPILRDIKHRKTRSSKSGSTNSSRKNSLFFKEEKAPTAESPVNASTFATEIFPSDDDNARVTAVAIDPAPETVAADTDRPETPAAVEECMHELPITTASVMPDATVSPETQAKAGVSNKREKSTQDGVSHKREKSTQDGVSHKREKSTQDGVSHKREKSMQDGVSHTREKSMQDGVSHKREKSTQDGVSHKREKSTQDGVSHKREKSTQDGVSHKREKSTQDGESHKREKSTEGGPALSHPKKSHRFGFRSEEKSGKKDSRTTNPDHLQARSLPQHKKYLLLAPLCFSTPLCACFESPEKISSFRFRSEEKSGKKESRTTNLVERKATKVSVLEIAKLREKRGLAENLCGRLKSQN